MILFFIQRESYIPFLRIRERIRLIMAERQKFNLKQELLRANDRIMGKTDGIDRTLSLLGISALTNPVYNNSMRTNMFTSHSRQFLTLNNPHFPKVYFGAENVVGDHSDGYRQIKGNKVVYKKIVKYRDIIGETEDISSPVVYELFLYDKKKDLYTVEHRRPCEDLTEIFGYDYNNDEIDKYEEGDKIKDGTILYRSTSYDEDMNYRFGQSVPVMYTLDPATFEDAAQIEYEFAQDFLSTEVETIEIPLNDNDYLLNIHGENIKQYQSLPKIGETVNGVLVASRRLFNNQVLYDFRNDNLGRIIDGDSVYHSSSTVLDYTIYCNNPDMPDNTFNRDILKYYRQQRKYWKEIHDTCKEIMKSGSKYSRDIDHLLRRSNEVLEETKSKWQEGDSKFSNVVLQILVEKHVGVYPGQKVTPRYGNKSVVSKIVKKEEMPYYYDDNGQKVHAKVLLNLLAIINRTTAYPLYEMLLTWMEEKCARKLRTLKTQEEQEHLFFEFLHDFEPEYGKESLMIYNKLSKKEKENYMKHVVWGDKRYKNGIFLRDIPFHESRPLFYRCRDILKKYDWLTTDQVYVQKWGREIPILHEYRISEMYIMKLKQTSIKGFSARNMGAVNSKGLPERSYKSRSHLEKTSSTPIRFGEYETLNFSIAQETEDHALFHALYRTSIKGRQDLAKIAMDPTANYGDISDTYDSRTAEIFSVILLSLSLELEFTDDENILRDCSDKNIGCHDIGGTTYICSDFTAMMLDRLHDIEKDVMKEQKIMDMYELRDMMHDKLINTNYIMGTKDDKDVDKFMMLYFD